jgi:hypothetical protein
MIFYDATMQQNLVLDCFKQNFFTGPALEDFFALASAITSTQRCPPLNLPVRVSSYKHSWAKNR